MLGKSFKILTRTGELSERDHTSDLNSCLILRLRTLIMLSDGVLSIEEFVEAFEMFMLDEDEFQNGAAPAEPDDDEDDEPAALPAQPAAQPVGATVTSPPPPAAPKAAAPAPRAYSGFPIEGPGFKVTLLRLRPRSSPLLLPHLCSLVPCPGPIVERCTLPKRGRVSASR